MSLPRSIHQHFKFQCSACLPSTKGQLGVCWTQEMTEAKIIYFFHLNTACAAQIVFTSCYFFFPVVPVVAALEQWTCWWTVVNTRRKNCVYSLQNESFYSVLQYWTQKYLNKPSCPGSNTVSFMRKLFSALNRVQDFLDDLRRWSVLQWLCELLILWDFSASVFELHLSYILQKSSIP